MLPACLLHPCIPIWRGLTERSLIMRRGLLAERSLPDASQEEQSRDVSVVVGWHPCNATASLVQVRRPCIHVSPPTAVVVCCCPLLLLLFSFSCWLLLLLFTHFSDACALTSEWVCCWLAMMRCCRGVEAFQLCLVFIVWCWEEEVELSYITL